MVLSAVVVQDSCACVQLIALKFKHCMLLGVCCIWFLYKYIKLTSVTYVKFAFIQPATHKKIYGLFTILALSTGTMSCIHVCVLQYWITEDVVWYTICVPLV